MSSTNEICREERAFYTGKKYTNNGEDSDSTLTGAADLYFPLVNSTNVVFKQTHALRVKQMNQGVDLSNLSLTQWGLSDLKFSHHIVPKKSNFKDVPVIFQVTICNGCCPSEEGSTVFLGAYADQESALLVNDVHEILNSRYERLSILRREDAMFFHHLTARSFDEIEGVMLAPAPVLSILEKIRIEAANLTAQLDDALDEKKRKRASSIDILIQSSLYLSMTSRDSLTSEDEGDSEAKDNYNDHDIDNDNTTSDREKDVKVGCDDRNLYTTVSKHKNHAPFFPSGRSHSPTASDGSTVTSSESRSINISDSDADSSVHDDSLSVMVTAAAAAHKALGLSAQHYTQTSSHRLRDSNSNTKSNSYNSDNNDSNNNNNNYLKPCTTVSLAGDGYHHTHTSDMHSSSLSPEQNNPLHLFTSGFSDLPTEPLPRTRRSNRPRASTFSVSSSHGHTNPQSLFDTEAERTPLGMITWLASLEDEDFVAAKMLAEFSNKDNDSSSVEYNQCDIPLYRGTRSKDLSCSSSASPSTPPPPSAYVSAAASASISASALSRNYHRFGGRDRDSLEPPTQRRRRANSVIEVTRPMKTEMMPGDEGSFDHGSCGKNPRTYRKDPNWASEGRSRGYVGAYSPAERRRRIERFLEKRRLRVWQKNVKYDVRKNFADSRIRVKGRFVKKEDQLAMIAMGASPKDRTNISSDCDSDPERGTWVAGSGAVGGMSDSSGGERVVDELIGGGGGGVGGSWGAGGVGRIGGMKDGGVKSFNSKSRGALSLPLPPSLSLSSQPLSAMSVSLPAPIPPYSKGRTRADSESLQKAETKAQGQGQGQSRSGIFLATT